MFRQKKYLKQDPQYIFDFIDNHPFATFVLQGEELLATHIPVLIEGTPEKFQLYGHIAEANEQYKFLKDGLEALLIFHGAHGYVSSSWYKDINISTWDYSAVHVNVKLKLQTRAELEESLQKLIGRFEKDQKCPVHYQDLPKDMVEDHLPLITGFWCEPVKVQAIAKLHQGFEHDDLHSVTSHLEQREDPLSSELSKNIKREHGTDH
ncbi:FMN-binding negative transcriptional regulator [Salinimicrobium oceani]|uniref:FMN-binding negative transcriptional regulator n=1 Tax=Salinimicrobium oceani TaxID=2722702 RepID=A0ABX1CYR2_9FLAO|nr:FMN-binding negative transcriptional regulator [Salinimicrobium oceani]NJW53085.1 FMN-binding negative transcriptional regulator [Salinimicrobium oceani]